MMMIDMGSKVKTKQVKITNKNAKTSYFWNFAKSIYKTDRRKLLDNMYIYEMNPVNTIQSGHDSVHKRTGRRADKVKPVYPISTSLRRGYTKITEIIR